ncbi:MAG TPA: LptA/OstA family protein, partial [Spirochaetia bacterium]|nr:LptA/OstA family protein [Spirochaetia bacterium]
SFHADTMRAELAEGKERTVLSGSATLISDDLVIQSDLIELFGEDFIFAECTGSVRVNNEKKGFNIAADKLFYNRRDKITRIQGNAVMEDTKNEIVIKGGVIENRDKEELVTVQIGVRILKKDLIGRSQMARYYRDEQKLELSGMPVVWWKEDEYRATKIYVNLETDEVSMEGDVQAQVKYKSEEDSAEKGPAGQGPAGQGPGEVKSE